MMRYFRMKDIAEHLQSQGPCSAIEIARGLVKTNCRLVSSLTEADLSRIARSYANTVRSDLARMLGRGMVRKVGALWAVP